MQLHNIPQASKPFSSLLNPSRPAKQAHRRLPLNEVGRLVAAYEAGETVLGLANQFGVHRSTVTTILKRENVQLRRKGLTSLQIEHAAELFANGATMTKISEKLGVAASTIWRTLNQRGVP